jgi:hypothetical protein
MIKASIFTISLTLLIFSFLGIAYAEDLLYTPHPNLDYIAVNNDQVSKEQEGFLKIYKQDVVKIAGYASPNDNVKVFFDRYEYTAHMNEYGSWFVLFSVQDMKVGSYPVSVQFNNGKKEALNILVIQEGDMMISDYSPTREDTKEKVEKAAEEKKELNMIYIVLGISTPLLLLTGALIGMYISKRKK